MTSAAMRVDAWVFGREPAVAALALVTALGMPEVAPRRTVDAGFGNALALSLVPPISMVVQAHPDPNDIGWAAMGAKVFEAVSGLADAFPAQMVWTVLRRPLADRETRLLPIYTQTLLLPEGLYAGGRHVRTNAINFKPPSSLGPIRSWDDIWSNEAAAAAIFATLQDLEWWPAVAAHVRAQALDGDLPSSLQPILASKERL